MKLSEIMTTRVVGVDPDDTLDDAIALLDRHGFRHLPVLRKGALVSLLSRRDVSTATGWHTSSQRRSRGHRGPLLVREIMRDRVVTLTPDHEVDAAASMMVGKRVGMIPVIDGNSLLVGVVTGSDILSALRTRNPNALLGRNRNAGARVSEYMQRRPATLAPSSGVEEAAGLCRSKDLRHLAVTESGEVVGLVSEVELRHGFEEATPGESGSLADVMVTDVVTIGPDEDLTVAADSMIRHKVSALPVVLDRRLVGFLTDEDVIQHFTARSRIEPTETGAL
jgi:acetoin utilization protein AcuB